MKSKYVNYIYVFSLNRLGINSLSNLVYTLKQLSKNSEHICISVIMFFESAMWWREAILKMHREHCTLWVSPYVVCERISVMLSLTQWGGNVVKIPQNKGYSVLDYSPLPLHLLPPPPELEFLTSHGWLRNSGSGQHRTPAFPKFQNLTFLPLSSSNFTQNNTPHLHPPALELLMEDFVWWTGVWRLPLYPPGLPSRYLSTLVCTYSVNVDVISVISGPILKLTGKYAHHEVTQVWLTKEHWFFLAN